MERTVVVAGVGPRFGDALCREFAREGWQVGLLARSNGHVEPLADELAAETPGDAIAVTADVTDPAAVERAVASVREAFGPVEVLIHNASTSGGTPVDEATPAAMRETWAVRAGGLHNCLRACLSDLRETEGALLVSGTSYAESPDPAQLVGERRRRDPWPRPSTARRTVSRYLRRHRGGGGSTGERVGRGALRRHPRRAVPAANRRPPNRRTRLSPAVAM